MPKQLKKPKNYIFGLKKAKLATATLLFKVPWKRRSSVNNGAWLRRFDDV